MTGPREPVSVGRIVHYRSYGTPRGEYVSPCRAAIVTAVGTQGSSIAPGIVALAVLNPEGMDFNQDVAFDHGEARDGGTWHWPERVSAVAGFGGEGVPA